MDGFGGWTQPKEVTARARNFDGCAPFVGPASLGVILPNYNDARLLPTALDAIVTQSRTPDELIIIDDGSTDNSVAIIEHYANQYPWIRLERNDRNRGVVYSVNRALELSQSEFLYFTACDDPVLPGFFEDVMKGLDTNPQAAIAKCDVEIHFENTSNNGINTPPELHLSTADTYIAPSDYAERVHSVGCEHVGTHVYKRTALFAAGGFLESLRWHCDWFVGRVMIFRYGCYYIPRPMTRLCARQASYSHRGLRGSQQREVLNQFLDLLLGPDYRDVAPLFARSAVLSHFGWPMARVVAWRPAAWPLVPLGPLLLAIWGQVKSSLIGYVPKNMLLVYRFVRNWLRRCTVERRKALQGDRQSGDRVT